MGVGDLGIIIRHRWATEKKRFMGKLLIWLGHFDAIEYLGEKTVSHFD